MMNNDDLYPSGDCGSTSVYLSIESGITESVEKMHFVFVGGPPKSGWETPPNHFSS